MAKRYPAMILAAGKGRRMQPHESHLPKPLVQIAGKPLIQYALQTLQHAGLHETVINLHHKAEMIRDYLALQAFDITLSYEEELLETGGGIRKALPLLQDCFFTLNSDVICVEGATPTLQRLNSAWNEQTMDGLLLLCPLEKAIGYSGKGDFSLAADGKLAAYDPKKPAYVYMGIQKLHQRFITQSGVRKNAFSLSPLYHSALHGDSPNRLYGLVHDGMWLHVGDPQGVALAEAHLRAQPVG